jgi:Rrf2 family protein
VRVSAKSEYAMLAAIDLASADEGEVCKGADIAGRQKVPIKFLEVILGDMRKAGLVQSQRGPDGGYRLSREPSQISVADVMRAVDGPLADVHGNRPENLEYAGKSESLATVWLALRASIRSVLQEVSLADLVDDEIPESIVMMASSSDPDTAEGPAVS